MVNIKVKNNDKINYLLPLQHQQHTILADIS